MKPTAAAAAPSADAMAAILAVPAVASAIAAESAKKVATRKGLLDTLAKAERASAKDWPSYTAAIDRAVAAQKRAEADLQAAKAAVSAAAHARVSASVAHDRLRSQIEAELRGSADNAAIDGFIDWARDDLAKTYRRRASVFTTSSTAEGVTTITEESFQASILRRIEATRAAIEAAEHLRFEADQSTAPAALAALRDGLPAIEALVTQRTAKAEPKPEQFAILNHVPHDPISGFIEYASRPR